MIIFLSPAKRHTCLSVHPFIHMSVNLCLYVVYKQHFLYILKWQMLHVWLASGAQWLSGRVLDSRPRGRGFEPHQRHCIVSLNKNIDPSLVLVQPRKTRPFITERLLMGRKESNQTNKQTNKQYLENKWIEFHEIFII